MTDLNDDLVCLSVGPSPHGDLEYFDDNLIPRADLPDYATLSVGTVDGANIDGGIAGRSYEIWVIEG
jgi:hypothetical protein